MSFEEIFKKSEYKPTEYKGLIIQIEDILPIPPNGQFNLVVEGVKSDWEQGIIFNSKGAHFVFNNSKESLNSLLLWQSDFQKHNTIHIIRAGKTVLKVWNMWRIEGGPTQYGHNGAAMRVEKFDFGRRYRCNDGYPDEDFDDLVFTLDWKH